MNNKELDTFAKAWVKYISVVALHGESATTRKGTEDAIKSYDITIEDFKNSLQSLLKQAELRGRVDEINNLMWANSAGVNERVSLTERLKELESQMEKEG